MKVERAFLKVDNAGEFSKGEQERLKRACKEFEGIFLAKLMKDSMKTASWDEKKKDTYGVLQDVAVEMAGEAIAKSSEGLGIGKMLYESLKPKNSE